MTTSPNAGDRSETEQAIMEATYRALCEYGYADLTTQRIAEKSGTSTAAIHYHYGTKQDLLVAFLEFLLDRFIERVETGEGTDPRRRLDRLLDRLFPSTDGYGDLTIAMLELRAQAPYDDAIRDRFETNDEYIRSLLEEVIADGIERGVFADADPEQIAQAVMTIVDGARTRYVVLDDETAFSVARETADTYLRSRLDDAPSP